MVGVMIDITEMHEFERALRQSEACWSTLFQQSPNPMILTGWDGAEILEVNDAWCAIWGHKRSAVVGKQTADIEIWRDISDRKPFDEELPRRGLVDGFEAKFLTKDGKSRIPALTPAKLSWAGLSSFCPSLPMLPSETRRRQLSALSALSSSSRKGSLFGIQSNGWFITTNATGKFWNRLGKRWCPDQV